MKIPRKILIVTGEFYPLLTPRAHRVYELSKGFVERGSEVEVLVYSDSRAMNNSEEIKKKDGIKISYVKKGFFLEQTQCKIIKRVLDKILSLLFRFELRQYIDGIFLVLKLIRNIYSFDLLISVSNPIEINLFSALALKISPKRKCFSIAEYSDPNWGNMESKNSFSVAKKREDTFISRVFDNVVVMTDGAKKIMNNFNNEEKIYVIPHAFDLAKARRAKFLFNKIPTFAFAGRFWPTVRNPEFFFKFLESENTNFLFNIFWLPNCQGKEIIKILDKYKKILKEKLIIKSPLPRLELVYELSKMDFLINFGNLSESQIPSKLVDYTLAGRPILSIDEKNFEAQKFREFMQGKYSKATKIQDFYKHDINWAVDQYLKIYEDTKKYDN